MDQAEQVVQYPEVHVIHPRPYHRDDNRCCHDWQIKDYAKQRLGRWPQILDQTGDSKRNDNNDRDDNKCEVKRMLQRIQKYGVGKQGFEVVQSDKRLRLHIRLEEA